MSQHGTYYFFHEGGYYNSSDRLDYRYDNEGAFDMVMSLGSWRKTLDYVNRCHLGSSPTNKPVFPTKVWLFKTGKKEVVKDLEGTLSKEYQEPFWKEYKKRAASFIRCGMLPKE